MYDPQNIFARILRKDIPCKLVLETPEALAFHDLHPKAPVHVLIIPKGAYGDASDFHTRATPQEMEGFYRACGQVAETLGVHTTGYRLVSNCGAHAGQEVPHYHVHLLGGKPLEGF